MNTQITRIISEHSEEIKKLIEETEPRLLIDASLSNKIIENVHDNSFIKEPYDDSPPWPGEWDNED